jgi:hypothetical protein
MYTAPQSLLDDHVRGDEMGGECSTYRTDGKCICNK